MSRRCRTLPRLERFYLHSHDTTPVAADFLCCERSQKIISVLPFFAALVVGRNGDKIELVNVDDVVGQYVTIGFAET